MPDLSFNVESALPVKFAASPMLHFKLNLENRSSESIHTIVLNCQIRIDPSKRQYTEDEQAGVHDLFGERSRWGQTLKPMLWTHASVIVPAFKQSTSVNLPVPCTYDFNLAAAKFFPRLGRWRSSPHTPLQRLHLLRPRRRTIAGHANPLGQRIKFPPPRKSLARNDGYLLPQHRLALPAQRCVQRSAPLQDRKQLAYVGKGNRKIARPGGSDQMNHAIVDKLAAALLYEGYILYPYRPSVKNHQRWTVGGLYPQAWSESQNGTDPCLMQTECLAEGANPKIYIDVRFLQLIDRTVGRRQRGGFEKTDLLEISENRYQPWQEAIERRIELGEFEIANLLSPVEKDFTFTAESSEEILRDANTKIAGILWRKREELRVRVSIGAAQLAQETYKLTIKITNQTPLPNADQRNRDGVLGYSLISTHTVLGVESGQFISLTDPPEHQKQYAAACKNIGAWPILVGKEPQRDTILSSPIILCDYPEIAPESPGDLFDSTEIDEILTLRIMTLTEEEKKTAAATDARVGELLKPHRVTCSAADDESARRDSRDENGGGAKAMSDPLPADPFSFDPPGKKLMQVEIENASIKVGDRVRLSPLARADIFDMALDGKIATVLSIEQDFENRIHLAVTVDDDPGKDFGVAGQIGHRFFFRYRRSRIACG